MRRVLFMAATVVVLLLVAAAPVSAYPSGSDANQASNWNDQFPHPAQCFKHEAGDDSDHGSYSDDGETFTLNTFQQEWPGDHWEAIIVKAGSDSSVDNPNLVTVHPTAGVAYPAPDGKDISHVIVCKGTTPEEPDAPTVTPHDCEGILSELNSKGAVTVEGLEDDVFVQVNGPTVLTIEEDGTYDLAPGHYGYRAVFDGKAIGQGTFDIAPCEPPEGPKAPTLQFADCEQFPGLGSITVTDLEEGVFVQVNGPTVWTITSEGTYALEPGHYGYRAVFDGEPLEQGTFDIADCPRVDAFSLEVCPLTGEPVAAAGVSLAQVVTTAAVPPGLSAIRFRHPVLAILLLNIRIDGNLVELDDNGDVIVSPGVHAWSISNEADTEVLASGEVDCPVCTPLAEPTPPTPTAPPSDVSPEPPSDGPILPLVVILLIASGVMVLVPSWRRVS